jgi:transketolase
MRSIFNQVLVELAQNDPRIYMVLADIGYGEIEPFRDAFPARFINCGVAEQNMAGVACGVALEGNIVVTYSIANFPTLRCLEQIRNDSCYHNANVKIVIIGGGLAYGPLGVSHQATEDIAIMRALPNMVVVCPGDFAEAAAATRATIAHPGPVFYRCGYKKEPPIHQGPIDFKLGKAIQVRDGRDLTFIFTGTIGNQVLPAAEALEKEGIHCRVVSMHTVKPIDRDAILAAARETGGIVVVEEHQCIGGLGGAVAEVLTGACVAPKKFLHVALPDLYVSKVGTHEWLLDQYGLSTPKIIESVRAMLLGGKSGPK